MKNTYSVNRIKASVMHAFMLLLLMAVYGHSKAQGRVLINEYLPWPNNACGVTAEFIELYNFGPGPVNIGCYIVTDGDYSITIPPNTILQPGQFYVLAGQNTIPQNCGNDLRNVTVNLNWNTCGCTSAPIPTTGDGLMTDGGSGNEQVVLLDPNLTVVDAVVRDTPVEPSALITTSTLGGQCTARTFDLDNMNIHYETIGQSTGRGNSMARFIDGGCAWIKDTQETAGDPNNTPGATQLDASLAVTNGITCSNTGSVVVTVNNGNFATIFPMSYILARDADSNSIYNFNDTYLNGTDSTPKTVPVGSLLPGRYSMVVGTDLGCDLTTFNFVILGCGQVLSLQDVKPNNSNPSHSSNEKIVAYPNPARDRVTLLVNSSGAHKAGISIADMFGNIVQRRDYELQHGDNALPVDIRLLPAGLYFIHFTDKITGADNVARVIKGVNP